MVPERIQQSCKLKDSSRRLVKALTMLSVSAMLLLPTFPATALAQDAVQNEEWQFALGIYGWGANIGGKTPTGSDIEVNLDDILDNLQFTAMGIVGARKGKWSFAADIIYMDLESDKNSTVPTGSGPLGVKTDLELRAWVITPTVGYTLVESDNVVLNIRGGARYLSLDADLEMNVNTPSAPLYAKVSDSGNVWDAIIGVNGEIAFNKRWYAPYYLDIGTGDSDFTWQVAAGIGYKFDICDVILEYRYLSWDFDDNPALDNLNINGPMLGAKFVF